MKLILQRVSNASVTIENNVHAQVGTGYVLLVGVGKNDTEADIDFLVGKIVNMRLFENDNNKFDKSLEDVEGEVLIISQFTLFADYTQGRRPYFGDAADPKTAKELYEKFIETFKKQYSEQKVKSGVFAAKMEVELVNNGPVTLVIDSKK